MQLCGNKMNCTNCHLDVGTRPYSNNFLETYLKYPQYRAREGRVLTIEDRINNCFERPMNGKNAALRFPRDAGHGGLHASGFAKARW